MQYVINLLTVAMADKDRVHESLTFVTSARGSAQKNMK